MSHRLVILAGIVALSVSPLAFAEETREVKIEDLKLKIPASWKQQTPSNKLRLGQFAIPAAEGDKEPGDLSISSAGGGVKNNLVRWVEQFQAEGRKTKFSHAKSPLGEYVVADISGTYKKPIGPPIAGKTEPMPNARMLGVILSVENKGLYFLKLTGPEKTVAAAADAMRTAIGSKVQEEKPYDLEKEGGEK